MRLYASAVNKSNKIAQDFIRSQIVPSPMNLDTAIKSLYDDYGYQQNVIESLLPLEVRTLFFGFSESLFASTHPAEPAPVIM